MALRGVQRATMDLDFILMLEDMEKADAILSELLQAAGQQRRVLDWDLLLDYLRLFSLEHRLDELKSIYGAIE